MADVDRTARLARALRDNLRRRKAQTRETPPDAEPPAAPEPADPSVHRPQRPPTLAPADPSAK